jgi:hypothetical protein
VLIARAGVLRLLKPSPDPRREIREVAALGRLAFWLNIGEVLVPDRAARGLIAELVGEADETDRELDPRRLWDVRPATGRHEVGCQSGQGRSIDSAPT